MTEYSGVRLSEIAVASSPAEDTDYLLISRLGVSYRMSRQEIVRNLLANLSDVGIAAPANGDVLTYNSTSHLWVPLTPQSGGLTEVHWGAILDIPATFPPDAHTHPYNSLTSIPATFTPSSHQHPWGDLTSVPTEFPPSAHFHPWGDLTGVPATFPPSAHQHDYSTLLGIPSTFPPATHNHDDRYYTESELGVSNGGGQVHWDNVTNKPSFGGGGDMLATIYDTNANGVVDAAETVAWTGVIAKPATFPPDAHTHDDRYFTETELLTAGSGAHVSWANLTGVPTLAVGDMTKASYDTDGDGVVDQAASVPWTGVSSKPSTFAPSEHVHAWADLASGVPSTFPPESHRHPWSDLDSIPSEFTPAAHTHAGIDITSSIANADAVPWTGVSDKPTDYPPSAHTHVVADITDLSVGGNGFGAEIIIGNGQDVVATGIPGFLVVPFDCTIESCTLISDVVGTIVVDVWRRAGRIPPTDSSYSIVGAAKPTLSSIRYSTDSTLSGWSTALSKGDVLGFNVKSATTVKQVTLALVGTKV